MTVIQIVNKVLRRLREPEVTSLSETDYSELVADFVADIHKELLDYDWSSMQHTIEVPVDANQRVLDLSRLEASGGDIFAGSRIPTTDSIPLWAQQFDDALYVQGTPLPIALPEVSEYNYYQDTSIRTDYVDTIAFRAHPDRDGLQALLYPPPRLARHIRVRVWTPEAEIVTATDANRTLLVPAKPVYLGALFLALNERGEEIGEPGGVAETRYQRAFAEAKEADVLRKGDANQYIAYRD